MRINWGHLTVYNTIILDSSLLIPSQIFVTWHWIYYCTAIVIWPMNKTKHNGISSRLHHQVWTFSNSVTNDCDVIIFIFHYLTYFIFIFHYLTYFGISHTSDSLYSILYLLQIPPPRPPLSPPPAVPASPSRLSYPAKSYGTGNPIIYVMFIFTFQYFI